VGVGGGELMMMMMMTKDVTMSLLLLHP